MPVSPQSRLIQLDILRGVAIIMVLGHHQVSSNVPDSQPFRFLHEFCYRIGWTGVDLFFVLSGFLIGSLLFNELRLTNSLDVRRFLIRRGLKIWPTYYLFLAYVFVGQYSRIPIVVETTGFPVKDSLWSVIKGLAANVLNIQNYLPTIRRHTWSLAVEEHFYVALPFVLLAMTAGRRRSRDWSKAIHAIPALALTLLIACSLMRFYDASQMYRSMFPTHLRIDELFAGVVLAYWNCLRPGFTAAISRARIAILGVGAAFVAIACGVVYVDDWYRMPTAITACVIGYGAILMVFVTTPLGEGWLGRAMETRLAGLIAFVGTYSYSIYIWHVDLANAPLAWLYKTGAFGPHGTLKTYFLCTSLYLITATAVGIGMSRLIEVPVLRFRERFYPRPVAVITEDEMGKGGVPEESREPVAVA